MGYAQGILLAVQDMEDLRRYEKESEFEREKFEKNLTARYRSDILPFALEALKKQKALTIKEADLKRDAIERGFSRRVTNALYDRGQLEETVALAQDKNVDPKFVTILNSSLEKQLDKRIKDNPEEATDKMVQGVQAGLSVDGSIDTPEKELEAITMAKLFAADVSPDDLLEMTAQLQLQSERTYKDDPLAIRREAATELTSTEANRLKKVAMDTLGPQMGDYFEVSSDAYGNNIYVYKPSAPAEVKLLFNNIANTVKELNRSQDVGDVNAQDINNFVITQVSDLLKMSPPEQRTDTIAYLAEQLPNLVSLDPIAPPAFEVKPGGDGDKKPLTATGASMNISGASTFDEKVNAATQ
tara:strand:+ start:1784 stop:2851 length:1068 start_codon:yes stop_codon:yes gene_type:complete